MAAIDVGIDLGSTGLRAAYSAHGDAPTFVTVVGPDWPWLRCEPADGGLVPVSFPSLKSALGSAERAGSTDPTQVVTKALDMVRSGILRQSGASIGHTVISVPARFFTAQRTALLAAAAAAGLIEVSLISDSVATVIGQTEDRGTGTYLVYGMGYEGYELGLVRAVRSTYRVLGYEGAAAPCGAALDASILGDWLAALSGYGVAPAQTDWPLLRQLAEQVKLRLAQGDSVLFPWAVPALGATLHVQFDQASFNRQYEAAFAGTLDRLAELVTRAQLDGQAIDRVLLVGGSTALPVLRKVVDRLGRPVIALGSDHLAHGALLHAHQFGRRPNSTYDEPPPAPEPAGNDQARGVAPMITTVLTAPARPNDDPANQSSTLDQIRQLIDTGRTNTARGQLRKLIAAAQRMLDELDAVSSAASVGERERGRDLSAADLITMARKRFEDGHHQDAIVLAHLAWHKDRSDVDVFEEMLDLHCAAAMRNPTTTSFAADERWLKCALQHDPTNARTQALLAERNYLQGRDLLRAGNRDEAKLVLRAALDWAPEHSKAIGLLREIDH